MDTKKLLWLALALIVAISLVACSTNNSGNNQPDESIAAANPPESSAPSGEAGSPALPPSYVERLGFSGGNIGAGGLVCGGDDGYVYYRSESEGWRLYRAKPDGSDKAKVSDRIAEKINVLDGWVYFLDYPEGFPIYKVRTDGTEETKLIDGYCGNLYVADSGIYFTKRDENNASHIYHAELDGGSMTMLFADASLMYYYKGMVYLGANQLGVFDIATGEEKVLADTAVHNVSVDDTGIYYWAVDKGEFHRMDLDGSNDSVILQGGDFFNYTNGKLYYPKSWISCTQNGINQKICCAVL
jgi:hypothetical protein